MSIVAWSWRVREQQHQDGELGYIARRTSSEGRKPMLNRAALIVRPAQPFVDWALGLDDSGVVPNPEGESGERTVYLIPNFADADEAEVLLQAVFGEVFERELEGWHTRQTDWPQDRSFKAFKRWFKIEMHSIVEDLCAGRIWDEG